MSYSDEFDRRVIEELGRAGNFECLMPAHCAYQRRMAIKYFGPEAHILNVGCKEDPAHLGDWKNCVNLDACPHDENQEPLEGRVKNFVNANFLTWEAPHKFDGIVLGEVLEHCEEYGQAHNLVKKMTEDMKDDGLLVFTVPHDPRTKEEQLEMQGHKENQFFYVAPGITSWHSRIWTKEDLEGLMEQFGLTFENYDTASWFKDRDMYWHFFTARKK